MLPTFNTLGRVFVSTNLNKGFTYYNAMAVGGIDTNLPAVEAVYTINSFNKVVKVAEITSGVSETTSSLTGILPLKSQSNLETLLNKPMIYMQVHFGICSRPNDFNQFESALILKDVNLTNYSLSDVMTLAPNKAAVQETANITIAETYRVFPVLFTEVFQSSNIVGIDYVNTEYCSILNEDGSVWVAGKYGTNFNLLYSTDNGITWTQHPTNFPNHTGAENESAIKTAKGKVYWSISQGGDMSLYSADIEDIMGTGTVNPSLIYSALPSNIRDMDATDNYLWCCGGYDDSHVLRIDLSTNVAEEIDNGNFFPGMNANALDVYNDNFVVIVGDYMNFAVYQDGDVLLNSVPLDGTNSLYDVAVLTETHWVFSSDDGVYITVDGGFNWEKTLTTNSLVKLTFYDELLGYAGCLTGIYRTLDGGHSWHLMHLPNTSWSHISSVVISPVDVNNIFFTDSVYIINGVPA